jgi:hypothetical protein
MGAPDKTKKSALGLAVAVTAKVLPERKVRRGMRWYCCSSSGVLAHGIESGQTSLSHIK